MNNLCSITIENVLLFKNWGNSLSHFLANSLGPKKKNYCNLCYDKSGYWQLKHIFSILSLLVVHYYIVFNTEKLA